MTENNPTTSMDELRELLKCVTRDRGSSFSARCPSHDDKTPSLSVKETHDRFLLNCFAGCSFDDICLSLGMGQEQFFKDLNILGSQETQPVDIYDYLSEDGKLLFQVVRNRGKSFSCRRPSADRGWEYNLNGVQRVLFRLPELFRARNLSQDATVYVCEGEKDVESLESFGLVATCNPHGAGKWRDEYAQTLSGSNCVILPDNDDAGKKHALTIAKSLSGIAASIRIVELPGLEEKGDISDWLRQGNELSSLERIVNSTAYFDNEEPRGPNFNRFLNLDELYALPVEEQTFAVDQLLPMGGLSVFTGKPKLGKSTALRFLCHCFSCGDDFLNRKVMPGKVLYYCLEEKKSEVIRHFRTMGTYGSSVLIKFAVDPNRFIEELRFDIAHEEPIAIIIDPMSRVIRVSDLNDYSRVSQAFEPLVDTARNFGVHIVLAHHDGKGGRIGGDGVLGSTAIFGAVDTHIQLNWRDRSRIISSTNRYGIDFEESIIKLDREQGTISIVETIESSKSAALEEEILKCYEGDTEPLLESEIMAIVGKTGKASKVLRNLVERGLLLREGLGGKTDPYKYRFVYKPSSDCDDIEF